MLPGGLSKGKVLLPAFPAGSCDGISKTFRLRCSCQIDQTACGKPEAVCTGCWLRRGEGEPVAQEEGGFPGDVGAALRESSGFHHQLRLRQY